VGGELRPAANDELRVVSDYRKLEFFLLRYVPNAARDESINIGLVMTESGGDGGGFADVHFTQDWKRARCLFSDTDVEMLEALGREIKRRIANVQERALLIHEMTDRYSNVIQLSSVRQVLTKDPALEMKNLAATLVETHWMPRGLHEPAPRRREGRKWIFSKMTDAFEAAGVWKLLEKNLSVAAYTNDTDKFTFDFAYSIGTQEEKIRIFHAVSLIGQNKDAELFPFRVAKIVPKMAEAKRASVSVTAVVEDGLDAENNTYVASILAFMKDENIHVSALREMPTIAERARLELMA
jgi:hypothetical protein